MENQHDYNNNDDVSCLSMADKGGVLMWKEALVSGSSSQTSKVDIGGVLMWKEAPVSGLSSQTSIDSR